MEVSRTSFYLMAFTVRQLNSSMKVKQHQCRSTSINMFKLRSISEPKRAYLTRLQVDAKLQRPRGVRRREDVLGPAVAALNGLRHEHEGRAVGRGDAEAGALDGRADGEGRGRGRGGHRPRGRAQRRARELRGRGGGRVGGGGNEEKEEEERHGASADATASKIDRFTGRRLRHSVLDIWM